MKINRWLATAALVAASATLQGCSDSDTGFSVAAINPPVGNGAILTLTQDSFERQDLNDPNSNEIFGWSGFIYDNGNPVLGTSGNNLGAFILDDTLMGPAADGTRALYFYGREGSSIHDIYLISNTFNLSNYATLQFNYRYLGFGLNDPEDVAANFFEYIQVEVCADGAEACGLINGPDPGGYDSAKLVSPLWLPVREYDTSLDAMGLDGRNHNVSSWRTVFQNVDLTSFSNRSAVTFRVAARMRDGFVGNNVNNALEDGAAIDDITVFAICNPGDPCIPPIGVKTSGN